MPPPLFKAAILGIVQGLTGVPAGVVHRAPADRRRLLGYDDPGGVFTVMIQLGSILAIMWLYRAKIVSVVAGLPSDRDARHFALMIVSWPFCPRSLPAPSSRST